MSTDPRDSTAFIKLPATAGPDRRLPLAMKIPDVASELSTSVSKIYELVALGKLDLIKMGLKSSRVTGASVERLLAEHVQPSANIQNLKQSRKGAAAAAG